MPDLESSLGELSFRGPRDATVEAAIPVCGVIRSSFDIDHRTAFLLAHVDGVSTVKALAEQARLPLPDVIACVLELVALGLVRLSYGRESSPPVSGIFPPRR